MSGAQYEFIEEKLPKDVVKLFHEAIKVVLDAQDKERCLLASGMLVGVVQMAIAADVLDKQTLGEYMKEVGRREGKGGESVEENGQ